MSTGERTSDQRSDTTKDTKASASTSSSSPRKSSSSRKRSSSRKAATAEHATAAGSTSQADKALEKVREVREENERRARLHNRTVVVHEVTALGKDGKERDKPIELSAIDQRGYLNTHGEAMLDREGLIELYQKVGQMFQAVS